MRNEKGRRMIHLIAGGYLIYLVWQMFQSRSEVTGTELIISVVASIVFAVVGVVLIISAVRTLMKPDPEEEPGADEKESEESVSVDETAGECLMEDGEEEIKENKSSDF
ncbi:MAG: hypothetical protein LUE24_12265 [Lachnospiraceae bacterium]|nr:hypothetical protein [Lachnospiraceae bacterium]